MLPTLKKLKMPPSYSLNLPSEANLKRVRELVRDIGKRVAAKPKDPNEDEPKDETGVPYRWDDFEYDISRLLNTWLPFCSLSNVRFFSPANLERDDFGHEIDNILHVTTEDHDFLIFVESKNQSVDVVRRDRWVVNYQDGPSNVIEKANNQIKALLEFLGRLASNPRIKILYYLVSCDDSTQTTKTSGHRNAEITLLHYGNLIENLSNRLGLKPKTVGVDPKRICQSSLLSAIRLGLVNPYLGHPEASSAIRYVDQCRHQLDQSLFRTFSPEPEKWLINGCAGTGKTVLLAYSAAVFSSGFFLSWNIGEIGVYDAKNIIKEAQFDQSKGDIAIVAMSRKQLENLEHWFDYWVQRFHESNRSVSFRRPEFLLARNIKELLSPTRTWSAVFIDEAHDLKDSQSETLVKAMETSEFYLAAACDRHQKIKSLGRKSAVIKNISFKGKHVTLGQVYRNPAPIYIASHALRCRWFAATGPKIIPIDTDFSVSYGFEVQPSASDLRTLTIRSDAHPGNSWSNTVSKFDNALSVIEYLKSERLQKRDVLWVRFSTEDAQVEYDAVQNQCTYFNSRTEEASDLHDKYIKGQDYPVVVIEGFPRRMDRFSGDSEEDQMWEFRRQLYLSASRATCFLIFICNVKDGEESVRIHQEIDSLISAVSSPIVGKYGNGTPKWEFDLKDPNEIRRPDKYLDTADTGDEDDKEELDIAPKTEPKTEPKTVSGKGLIAPEYVGWPPPEGCVPSYAFVLPPVDELPSVEEFAAMVLDEDYAVDIVDIVLKALRKRGYNYSARSRIALPLMRSLAFEFGCYPAATEEEYVSLTQDMIEEHRDEAHRPTPPVVSQPATSSLPKKESVNSTPSPKLALPPDSRIERAKSEALDLFAEANKPKVKRSLVLPTNVFGSMSKTPNHATPADVTAAGPAAKHTTADNLPQTLPKNEPEEHPKLIVIKPPIMIPDLAEVIGLKQFHITAALIRLGIFPPLDQPLEPEVAAKVCGLYGFRLMTTDCDPSSPI